MDKIRNYELRERLGIVLLSAKMHENRLGWFGHVKRKITDASVKMVEILKVEGKQSQDKSKKTLKEQIKIDLRELHLFGDLTKHRISWKRYILILYLCSFLFLSFSFLLSFIQLFI